MAATALATSRLTLLMPAFKSAKQRRYLFAAKPTIARGIARTDGAKIRGGFTKAQTSRRRSAAGKGQPYQPR